ncbi:hypothetical protein HC028_11335 [Planosporangium flavigriseum]|uniref:Uncharacterized protein n=1 Tax=Planosporangium flavigriseum TaxID=373681 RepID=A0A8J3LE16_9ACTN|nr:hypothetical protein [Planosporangium flavigriseum]NJC65092.1 hypothetical protein [Planosporangium flavigriseum]GIG71708.1 hypothetical protein Pfl04_01120 [Planosporangium flavigriseum]
MDLPKSRTAYRQAERAFDKLSALADAAGADEFRDEFVSCIGMIQRVGPILYNETKGHRTATFGAWWQTTGQDPLFRFMADVRNAEFKRAENRKVAHHDVVVHEVVTVTDAVHVAVIRDGKVVEEHSHSDPLPPPPVVPEPTHTVTWYFSGGTYDGQEVLGLLRQYLVWIRDVLIPTAERLTP